MNKSNIDAEDIDKSQGKINAPSHDPFNEIINFNKSLKKENNLFELSKQEVNKNSEDDDNIFTFKKKLEFKSDIKKDANKDPIVQNFQQNYKMNNNPIFDSQKSNDLIDFEKDKILEEEINKEIREEQAKKNKVNLYNDHFSDSDNDEYDNETDKNTKENIKFSEKSDRNDTFKSTQEINKKKQSTIKFLQDNSSEDESSNEIVHDEPLKLANDNDTRAKSFDPFMFSDISPVRSENPLKSIISTNTNKNASKINRNIIDQNDISMGQGINIDDTSKIESNKSYNQKDSK